jgi:hypothetical protein
MKKKNKKNSTQRQIKYIQRARKMGFPTKKKKKIASNLFNIVSGYFLKYILK